MLKRRNEFLDSRVNQTAVDLFRLARKMLGEGFATNSVELLETSSRDRSRPRPSTMDARPSRLRDLHHGAGVVSAPC